MLRFKSFRRAQTLLAGIELLHMIRKDNINIHNMMDCHPWNNSICWLPK